MGYFFKTWGKLALILYQGVLTLQGRLWAQHCPGAGYSQQRVEVWILFPVLKPVTARMLGDRSSRERPGKGAGAVVGLSTERETHTRKGGGVLDLSSLRTWKSLGRAFSKSQ